MLKELHISNYVLIDHLDIDFSNGFSVLTGETGAGKSIILGALNLLLGGRADAKTISHGFDRCVIEGHFSLEGYGLEPFFEDNGLDYDATDTILRRELTSAGKSRAFINDTPVTQAQLKQLGSMLIDIHSQHQNLALGTQSFQLATLDTIAANSSIYSTYLSDWEKWTGLTRRLEELKNRSQADSSELEYLQFQLDGIMSAKLQDGEQEELEQESQLLEHAEDIKQDLFQAWQALDGEQESVVSLSRQAIQSLRSASRNYADAKELTERMESCLIELRDIADTANQAQESISFDPARQQYVNERLDLIYSLEKKHHKDSIAMLLEYANDIQSRLQGAVTSMDDILELEKQTARAFKELEKSARALSESRKNAAQAVEKQISGLLVPLGIPNVRFSIQLDAAPRYERSGADNVCFMFSANKSQPMQELSDVASGGEIARVMLCLKSLIASARMLPTVIFDEIDTGVSGAVAQRMAQLMKQMASGNRQVIAITHLPQIAALGQSHYKVFKKDDENGTHSSIVQLDNEERVREIAGMMSGETLSQAALENARTLIENGR
ncbi:MAG: DNA repair protein RecN [Bacteroidaceae bacterium]|nr:DNA repair protein RecN [Bacteroidaceae bacterium]